MNLRHTLAIMLYNDFRGRKTTGKADIRRGMHLISQASGENFKFEDLPLYGLYSPMVEQAIDELIGLGFVDITCTTRQPDNYHLTQEGEQFVREITNERV